MKSKRYQRPAIPLRFVKVPLEAVFGVPVVLFGCWKFLQIVFAIGGVPLGNLWGFLIALVASGYYIRRWWRIGSENPFAGQELKHSLKNTMIRVKRKFRRMSYKEKGMIIYVARR